MKFPTLTSATLALSSLCSLYAKPTDLNFSKYAGPDLVPSPACLAASAEGDVYVGVDLLGSLGKGPNKGSIVKLTDTNNDGVADKHTVFAELEHPRGIIPMGDKVYVLHAEYQNQKEMQGMYLSVLTDKDGDGKADGPAKHLIKDISTIKFNRSRGADHTTNGIRMGIDGWIYIAVGDFGFVDAEGTDGTKMTMVGGGVVRVRPDGSDMELYSYGLRNIYDVAIDPFMNIFTRGNTNDGVGWWIRFIDHIQTGDYGYPSLYMYNTSEIIPALADLGRGSGTGAMYLDEPTWAKTAYNKQPLMVDWGRNHIYIHSVEKDGPSFTQEEKEFIQISQPTDIDVDGSGRMYIASWNGAGYKGSPKKGFVERAVPQGWSYKAFPDLKKVTGDNLVKGLKSPSAKARLAVSQQIIENPKSVNPENVLAIAKDTSAPLEGRVAAIFAYIQLTEKAGIPALMELAKDATVREFALRAATDLKSVAKDVPTAPYLKALKDPNPRVVVAALVGLGRIGDVSVAPEVAKLSKTEPKQFSAPKTVKPLFTSDVIGSDKIQKVEVQLEAGANKLYLIGDANGDTGNDHIVWFDPQITKDGKTLKLKKWKEAKQGWGKTSVGKSANGKALKSKAGHNFEFGIGSHTQSSIQFEIPSAFVGGTFTATVGYADTALGTPNAVFKVSHAPIGGDNSREKGPHATPNSGIIIPHIAVQTLRELKAVDAALAALDTPAQDGAIWALRRMHEPSAVDGLIAKLNNTSDQELKTKIMDALARLYSMETPYKGDTWWNTKPDPHGPYYWETTWSESDKIAKAYKAEMAKAGQSLAPLYISIAKNNKAFIPGINDAVVPDGPKIAKVADVSIENVMLAFEKHKPNLANGKKVLAVQACVACHSMEDGQRKLGPDLNKIGSILDREAIAEAILKPDATIAHNWVTATMKDGTEFTGTLISQTDDEVVIRNIAGVESKFKGADVKSVKVADSTIMGPHLLDALTLQEFVDVISYLASKK